MTAPAVNAMSLEEAYSRGQAAHGQGIDILATDLQFLQDLDKRGYKAVGSANHLMKEWMRGWQAAHDAYMKALFRNIEGV